MVVVASQGGRRQETPINSASCAWAAREVDAGGRVFGAFARGVSISMICSKHAGGQYGNWHDNMTESWVPRPHLVSDQPPRRV